MENAASRSSNTLILRVPRFSMYQLSRARLTELANGAQSRSSSQRDRDLQLSQGDSFPNWRAIGLETRARTICRHERREEGRNKNGSDFHSPDKGSLVVDGSVRRMAGGRTLVGLHLVELTSDPSRSRWIIDN